MEDIEWIDTNDELSRFVEELSDLKNEVNENPEVQSMAKEYWVSEEIFREFYNILKDYFWSDNIDRMLSHYQHLKIIF